MIREPNPPYPISTRGLCGYAGQIFFAGWKYQSIPQKMWVMWVDPAGSTHFAIFKVKGKFSFYQFLRLKDFI